MGKTFLEVGKKNLFMSIPHGHELVCPTLGLEARLTRLGTRPCQHPATLCRARVKALLDPTLALRALGSRLCLTRVGPDVRLVG